MMGDSQVSSTQINSSKRQLLSPKVDVLRLQEATEIQGLESASGFCLILICSSVQDYLEARGQNGLRKKLVMLLSRESKGW